MKIRNVRKFTMGLLAANLFVFIYIMDPHQIGLRAIFLLCFSLTALDGILDNKTSIIYCLIGVMMMISLLIMLLCQKVELYSFDVVLFGIVAIIFIIFGIGTNLGFLPEAFHGSNLE